MKTFPTQACSPALLAQLREKADAYGLVSFRDFMAVALYAPEAGYYAKRNSARVGRNAKADFYTASSLSGGIFGQLLRAAAARLLTPNQPDSYSLVEIAAEPGKGIFSREAAPFAHVTTRHLGEPLAPPANAVVFANEWLDAQPFHRLVFRQGKWRELGVQVGGDELSEQTLMEISAPAQVLVNDLPAETTEDYHLDISLDAENLLRTLATGRWTGCLVLADYGYDWATLSRERPAGTARAYRQHQVTGDLLDHPGEQDLTCHVCWDRLETVLRETGFTSINVERQEAFFVHQAAAEIEKILTAVAGQFSPARQTLLELINPAHLGQKFQILSARR